MLTREDIGMLTRETARLVFDHVASALAPVHERLKDLEAREPRAGVDGKDGRDGINGKDGRDGEKGADGLDGRNGLDGSAGKDGEPGKDGIDGQNGIDGRNGLDGKDGKDGRDGTDGRDGRDGADGRDASDLDVLPAIDFARNYARGTLASHQGGLWRAYTNTDGPHGWGCIVDGIAGISVEPDGERGIAVTITCASGTIQREVMTFPVQIYRNVWRAENVYERGDTVTWAGSLWHCNATTNEKPDAGGDAWTLCTKRGRDGKDARP
jgi:Collagen triple helix repeat (20 copies)